MLGTTTLNTYHHHTTSTQHHPNIGNSNHTSTFNRAHNAYNKSITLALPINRAPRHTPDTYCATQNPYFSSCSCKSTVTFQECVAFVMATSQAICHNHVQNFPFSSSLFWLYGHEVTLTWKQQMSVYSAAEAACSRSELICCDSIKSNTSCKEHKILAITHLGHNIKINFRNSIVNLISYRSSVQS